MLAPGQTLLGREGSYVVGQEHGRGGFGVTYRARREADGCQVILKVLRLDRVSDWKAVQLFQREAEVLRSLSHPGIPRHIDDFPLGSEAAPQGFALVQEFIEGENLAQGQRIDEARMLGWFAEILRVLDYLHRLSPPVIHRDVTPKNIILRPDGRPALVDFGSVQAALRSANTLASTAAGTFGYAPPEQFVGRASPSSDLFGLAMTFLAVWSGLSPEQMPLDGARVDVPAFFKADPRLVNLLTVMTEPDPRKRLRDASSALQRLSGVLGRAPEVVADDPGSFEAQPRAADVDGYVALLQARLREEGFVVLPGSMLGDVRVKLVARRVGASARSAGATYVYVARDHDLQSSGPDHAGQADRELRGQDPIASQRLTRLAFRAHASAGGAWNTLLRGSATILPIVVTDAAPVGIAERLQSLEGRGATAIPIVVDLSDGAVHVARVSKRASGQVGAYLPYYWWLAAPRLLEKPRVRPPSSTLRVALAVALGAALMFGSATLYGLSQAVSVFNALMIASDPSTHTLVVKTYTFGKEVDKSVRAMTLSASGVELATRKLPADAWFCGFSGRNIVYATSDDKVWSADYGAGDPSLVATLPVGHTHCAVLGDRIAYDRGSPRAVYILQAGGEVKTLPGSELGDSHPAWFASGNRLALAAGPDGARHIVLLDLSSGERTAITEPNDGSSRRDDTFPSVSPDETRLLFSRIGRRATGDQARFNRDTDRVGDLYVVDLATKQLRLLVQDTCGIGPKRWLSNTTVALTKWTGEEEGCGAYLFDLSTGDMSRFPDYEAF